METTYILSIIATTIEMAVCLVSARQLWRMRGLANDRSRRMLIIGTLFSGLLALWILVMQLIMKDTELNTPILHPWICWMYMSMNVVMTLYPISVIHPKWLTPRRSIFLFLPTLILAIGNFIFWNRWTQLETPDDIWINAWKPDVLLRLVTLFIMVPYVFLLTFIPRNYRQSSASKWWTLNYSMGLLVLCTIHIVLMLTVSQKLIVVLPLMAAAFFLFSTEYELEERLRPSTKEEDEDENSKEEPNATPVVSTEMDLWSRVKQLMDEDEVWRDPDLTLASLSRLCATNITYLSRVIQQETNNGFKELVNAKRVASVENQLKENPDIDIQTALFNAGYRSRTTAWRNFKDITGVSPAEYKLSLKKQ